MSEPSLSQRFRYKFDNYMAKGGSSMFASLVVVFLVALALIVLIRLVVYFLFPNAGDQWSSGFLNHIYIIFLQMTDPGNMAQDITSSPLYKISAVVAGLAGVVLLSMLIGLITTALVQKLEALRKGHSKVIESGHTLILGWNDQRVLEILKELVMANESEDDPSIVVLAERPKEEMDDYLRLVLPDTQNTRVVTRSGSPSSLTNLAVASVENCKSVIVLATAKEGSPRSVRDQSDAKVIKTILAVAASREELPERAVTDEDEDGESLNIVAEIFDDHHRKIVQQNCPHPITVIDSSEILAKIMVQTSRSVGLSVVYGEILSFDGCEMYFADGDWGSLEFGKVQYHFPDGVPMGIRDANGDLHVNPDSGRVLTDDDELLILADDDSTIEFRPRPVVTPRALQAREAKMEQRIERELFIGWSRKARIMVREYADYVLEGSSIEVLSEDPDGRIRAEVEALDAELDPLQLTFIERNPLRIETLIEAEPSQHDNIIMLSEFSESTDAEKADSETILILLLLRRIFEDYPDDSIETKLITEVIDSSNQGLVARAGVKDFIISDQLISMMLAQVSEEADIKRVYDDLFAEDGSEIYLKPCSLYFESESTEVSFADCMQVAQSRSEICLGVKIKAEEHNGAANFGVRLIPEKSTQFTLGPEDCLVVLAEDET